MEQGLLLACLVLPLALGAVPARADHGGPLPDFDRWWDPGKPAETEARFRELLPRARASGDACAVAELLTQIARTRGLQRDFEDAHALLDEAAALAGGDCPVARVRVLLERGRALNSGGRRAESRPLFFEAFVRGTEAGLEGHTVDAVHMLGIVSEPDEALLWSELAIALAERASAEEARRWLGALYNNVGWTHHDQGRHGRALHWFEKGLAFREARGQAREARIAKWTVARALRSLGRLEEALERQRALLAEYEAAGDAGTGFVLEEVGECLWALGRKEEGRPFLAGAYDLLRGIPWMAEGEATRLESLKSRGRVPE